MAHNKGTGFSNFNKPVDLRPPISDPTYPLRVLQCRQVEVSPIPGQVTFTVAFSPEPDVETELLIETWEDIP